MFVFVLQRNQKCSSDFFETNPFKLFLFSSKCIMPDLTERYEIQKKFVLLPVCFSFGINCSDELEDIVRWTLLSSSVKYDSSLRQIIASLLCIVSSSIYGFVSIARTKEKICIYDSKEIIIEKKKSSFFALV